MGGEGKKNTEMPPNQTSEKAWELSGEEESTFYIIHLLSFNHHPSCCQQPLYCWVMAVRWEIHLAAPGERGGACEGLPPQTPSCSRKLPSPGPVCQGDKIISSPLKQLTKQLAKRQSLFREMLMMPREELIMCHGNNFVPVKVLQDQAR